MEKYSGKLLVQVKYTYWIICALFEMTLNSLLKESTVLFQTTFDDFTHTVSRKTERFSRETFRLFSADINIKPKVYKENETKLKI